MLQYNKKSAVAVVHLIWIPLGMAPFLSFIASYRKYASGYPHLLVLLFNGVKSKEDTDPYHQYAKDQALEYISFYRSKGHDLEAYVWLAPQVEVEYLLFLNSYSELMAENWLLKYLEVVRNEKDTGIVGATASYQSYYSSILLDHPWPWNKQAGFRENYRKYKLIIKTILLYRFYFKPFPNPHIRTNAFLISRDVFRSVLFRAPKNKLQAYAFESGRKGLTVQLQKKNLQITVVDKHGASYKMSEWRQSQTFWTGEQQNLLVSDNQTRKFCEASKNMQRRLAFKAWGKQE